MTNPAPAAPVVGTAAAAAAGAAAVTVLRKPATRALRAALGNLYADAYLAAAHVAAVTVSRPGAPVTLTGTLGHLNGSIDWGNWRPGQTVAADLASDGGLADLLASADITIKGIVGTTLDRLGDRIADGVHAGSSVDQIAADLEQLVADPGRAWLIADTETARVMDTATRDVYEANGVPAWDWLLEADACDICQGNADGGPYLTGTGPDIPAHPRCRCARGARFEPITQ